MLLSVEKPERSIFGKSLSDLSRAVQRFPVSQVLSLNSET